MGTVVITPPTMPNILGTSAADIIDPGIPYNLATAEEARARADRIRVGLPTWADVMEAVAQAKAHEDWRVLGYPSWHAYERGEFGQVLDSMIEQRRARAAELREHGQSTRRIAAATGVSQGQVRKDLEQVSTGTHLKPESPATVTGADGKQYPASRPVSAPPAKSTSNGPPAGDEQSVARRQAIDAARHAADTIVSAVLGAVTTIVAGCRCGEHGLVTTDMIVKLREAVDLLAEEVE